MATAYHYFYTNEYHDNLYAINLTTGIIEDEWGYPFTPAFSALADKPDSPYGTYIKHYHLILPDLRVPFLRVVEKYPLRTFVDEFFDPYYFQGNIMMLEHYDPSIFTPTKEEKISTYNIAYWFAQKENISMSYVYACITAHRLPNIPDYSEFVLLLAREGIAENRIIMNGLLPRYYLLKMARNEPLASVRNIWHDMTRVMKKAEWVNAIAENKE